MQKILRVPDLDIDIDPVGPNWPQKKKKVPKVFFLTAECSL
jgi:hypothetical protein